MQRHPWLAFLATYVLLSATIVTLEGIWPGTYVDGQNRCFFGCGDFVDSVLPIVIFWPISALLDIVNGIFSQPIYVIQGLFYLSVGALMFRWWWVKIWRESIF